MSNWATSANLEEQKQLKALRQRLADEILIKESEKTILIAEIEKSTRLRQLNAELLQALERYGNHEVVEGVSCCAVFDGKPCNCGFEAVIQKARQQERQVMPK